MIELIKNTEVSKSVLRHQVMMAFLFGSIMTLSLISGVIFVSTIYAVSQDREASQEEMISYTGVIQKVDGVSIAMAGRYELVDGDRRVCLLTSRQINLDAYINHKVTVAGVPKVAVEGGSLVLMVLKVEPLN